MIGWETLEQGIRVHDGPNVVDVHLADWTDEVGKATLPKPVDLSFTVDTAKIELETETVMLSSNGERVDPIAIPNGKITLDDGRYLLHCPGPLETTLLFSGPASIRQSPPTERCIIDFDRTESVQLGFNRHINWSSTQLTIPPSVAGYCTALTHLSVAHTTDSPERSDPRTRHHPPLIEIGENQQIPSTILNRQCDRELSMVVPESKLMPVLILSPLAYYLSADVRCQQQSNPEIILNNTGEHVVLPMGPALEQWTMQMLRRLVFLDSLLRQNINSTLHVEEFGIDPGVRDLSTVERFNHYRAISEDHIAEHLPSWHLSASVPPCPRVARVLPYLLDRMSIIMEPRTGPLNSRELLERSLTDFYRDETESYITVDAVTPEKGPGRSHAWFGPEIPIDVFTSSLEAYKHSSRYRGDGSDHRFVVILNDEDMEEEHERVTSIYRRQGRRLPIDVTVRYDLTKRSLAEVFEQPATFVHFVGHCDSDGLRCPDGAFDVSTLSQCNVETFFLNACGSYYVGRELIRKGSVAGATTFTKVLNEQAATVGTTFARLIVQGFSMDRAMQLARRQIMMGKNYSIVGDGTHVLEGCRTGPAITYQVKTCANSVFRVEADVLSPQSMGGTYSNPFTETDDQQLVGVPVNVEMNMRNLLQWLETITAPILFEDSFFFPEDLVNHLKNI